MSRETGKALGDAEGEVMRSQDTMKLSAEEAIRIEGEHIPLDGSAMGAGKMAFMMRFPVGVVGAGITPFNAPFNLACHKVGPAIAAGNAIVLKPPPQSPCVVHKLASCSSTRACRRASSNAARQRGDGAALVRDPRRRHSHLHRLHPGRRRDQGRDGLAPRSRSNSAGAGQTIVHADADVKEAPASAPATPCGSPARAASPCRASTCPEASTTPSWSKSSRDVRKMRIGDPLDPSTDVGTLIDERAAMRVESWIREAEAAGARVLTGGHRTGAQLEPTVMVDVDQSMKVVCDEVFGPVVSILPYYDFEPPASW